MNDQKFKENLTLFCENYNFEASKPYIKLVFNHLESRGVTDMQFKQGVNTLMNTKKKSDFYGRPAVADWLDVLGLLKKPLSLEKVANQEATKLIEYVTSYTYHKRILFDNPTTNATIEAMGGIADMCWNYSDTNPNKKDDLTWFRKEFIQYWLDCYDLKKEKTTPLFRPAGHLDEVEMIGDKQKCLAMLEKNKLVIENDNTKVLDVVGNLSNKLRG